MSARVTIEITEAEDRQYEAVVRDQQGEQFAKVYCGDAWLTVESCATYVAALLNPDPVKSALEVLGVGGDEQPATADVTVAVDKSFKADATAVAGVDVLDGTHGQVFFRPFLRYPEDF